MDLIVTHVLYTDVGVTDVVARQATAISRVYAHGYSYIIRADGLIVV
jgi:hypothetical protein